MSLKVKLISCISVFMLMIGILIIGVYAATQQTINLKGSINYEVANKSLYVSDIRIQTEVASEAQTIDNFMQGYINDTLNVNIGEVTSESAIFEEKESYTYQMSVSDGSSSGGLSYTITWNVTSPTGGDSETTGNSVTCYEGDTVSVTINYNSSYTYSDEYYEYYYDYYLSFYGYALDENGDNTGMVHPDGTTLSFTAGEVDETIYAEFSENFYQQEIHYDVAVNNVYYNYNISDSDEFYSEVSGILAGYELYYVNGGTYGGYTVIFNDINYYNQSTTNWHYSLQINTSGSYYEYRVDSENHIIYVDITIDVYVNALITD